ncbi:probable translation elongation factor eEF4 [Cephalotrichum gorgonifer]|uniref:Ribosome assembly protein 1 n=1 Tax=Cephalotrichum gorgonifer TaxID=2041049 RepID=A0AAE8N081_9PEZI|nr:probable translation elongation factor eEF4 [Cephalotrichum gorgonifer]
MPIVDSVKLASLQNNADGVRNICILAHVDHGKTSLTDVLLATNGIISPKMAGKIRYLDSRPDEQLRGITMESSAISLYFSMLKRKSPEAQPEMKEYLINLIDSPGHIDFSSEVSTASRLCDGAVVLVDAVEGVCSQTVTVLRQVWIEKLKPLLVFNKLDRLITELRMTPEEAYNHLSRLLEQVNAVLGSFYQGDRMEEDLNWREKMEQRAAAAKGAKTAGQGDDLPAEYEEKDDEDLYFAPERNNVIFSSAIDGWAFTVRQFAGLYEKKLGIKRTTLEKVLWGNFYLDPKTKKLLGPKHLKGRSLKPLFVQLVLEPVWAVYNATIMGDHGKGDPELLQKITKSLNVTIPPHVLRAKDPRLLLTTVFSSWLPLSTALLVSVVETLPPPNAAQAERVPDLLDSSPGSSHINPAIRDAMTTFKTSRSDPVVAFVSKMVSVPESEMPENKRKPGLMSSAEARELAIKKRAEAARAYAASLNSDENEMVSALETATLHSTPEEKEEEKKVDAEHLIGFARIYSGTLSVGDTLYVVPPKWSPADGKSEELEKVEVTGLYMLMGRTLETLDTVPAGVVFGIAGLAGRILKSGTLCSTPDGAVNLAGVNTAGKPIVRVALEPENPADLDKMISGLHLLVQSDPCAEYEQFESGEHVLLTAGELHLERCIKDLQERFARCEIQVGAPIVPYKETIVRDEEMRPPANKELGRGVVVATTSSKQVSIRIRVLPLPKQASDFLEKNGPTIRQLYSRLKGAAESESTGVGAEEQDVDGAADLLGSGALSLEEFKKQLQSRLESAKSKEPWKGVVDRISSFGPRRTGANILVDATADQSLSHLLAGETSSHALNDKIAHAFQLATAQGPLCAEPVHGIAVFIESLPDAADADPSLISRLTGEVIRTTQRAIHSGFLDWSPRLMLALYAVEVQATLEVLGRTNDVLTRRRARIVDEAMNEGTPFYSIRAVLPAAESFGFADEMRKKTSGAAQPQLIFAGFEILDEDPLWQPFTEDELEDLGELADRENSARKYMDGVRRRKGMLVEGRNEATSATKQKTLKR